MILFLFKLFFVGFDVTSPLPQEQGEKVQKQQMIYFQTLL